MLEEPTWNAGLTGRPMQFETIHPFLDGYGRIGRSLTAALLEQWGLLPEPLSDSPQARP